MRVAVRLSLALVLLVITAAAHAQRSSTEEIISSASQTGREVLSAELKAALDNPPPVTDDKHELAVYFHRRGMANVRIGRTTEAVADLERALENNQPSRLAPGGWGDRWRIQNDLSNTYGDQGDHFKRITYLQGVAREYAGQNHYRHFYAQMFLTVPLRILGRWQEAERALQEGTALLPLLRQTRAWSGREEYNVRDLLAAYTAYFRMAQGKHQEAEQLLRGALREARDYLRAIEQVDSGNAQTLRIARGNIASRHRWLSSTLSSQGKLSEAEYFARTALEDTLSQQGINTSLAGYDLTMVAWATFQQGRLPEAERLYGLALQADEKSGSLPHSTALAARRGNVGMTLAVQGKWKEALAVFDVRDAGLRTNAEQFKLHGSNHMDWALSLHRQGDSARALAMLERMIAVQERRAVLNTVFIAQLRGYRALVLASLKRDADALAAFAQALPVLVEPDSDGREAEDVGFLRTHRLRVIVEAYLELLAQLHAEKRTPGGFDAVAEAFAVADAARGSGVQHAISLSAARAQLPDAELADLARREQDALNRIIALNQVIARLSGARAQQRLDKVIADLQRDVALLRKQHAALQAEIRSRFPRYASLVNPGRLSLTDFRRMLREDEAVVATFVGETQSYAWTVTRGGATFRTVKARQAELDADVQELRRAFDLPEQSLARLRPFNSATAHKLYNLFLAPAEAEWAGARLLTFIPHGALSWISPAILHTAPASEGDYAAMPWLIQRIAVAQVPSASALAALRAAPPPRADRLPFIGYGDPLFSRAAPPAAARGFRTLSVQPQPDAAKERLALGIRSAQSFDLLSALPDTADELQDIARTLGAQPERDVYLQNRATERNVKRLRLDDRKVLAFATHGLVPGEIPGLDDPALALSNPALSGDEGEDGFLTMEEVLALKLDADWVVLSACNTASADGRGSEALSGLGRAFFYAGARSLLVTNWAVETTSARRLTTEVFRLQAAQPGLRRAEALRQSMRNVMRESAPGGFSYAHPLFWAPFALVGDGG